MIPTTAWSEAPRSSTGSHVVMSEGSLAALLDDAKRKAVEEHCAHAAPPIDITQSSVPLLKVLALCGAIAGSALWLGQKMQRTEDKVDALAVAVQELRKAKP
jgi:hypothetical protein